MENNPNIVGNCPECGAPIYTSGSFDGESIPQNIYSCECRNHSNTTASPNRPLIKHGIVRSRQNRFVKTS